MRRLVVTSLLLFTAPAALAAEVNGYVSSRSQYTEVRTDGLLASDDVPTFSELLELNAQLRAHYRERSFVYGDLSLFGQVAGGYRGLDPSGAEVDLGDRNPAGVAPFISLNELYLSHEFLPSLVVTLGKKRIVWGPGMAFNPTDLLNPLKDPTDPSLQRAGAWLAQVEFPLETVTFSFAGSARVTAQAHGIPYRLLYYPAWNEVDEQAHWLIAARMYALIEDADVNVMAFYGNRHPDEFSNKLRAGLSFSRMFAEVNELHLEALLQSGSPRTRIVGECVTDRQAAARCAMGGQPLTSNAGLEESGLKPRVLVGARRQFDDESMLSVEYLYQADGYTRSEMQDLVNALSLMRAAKTAGLTLPTSTGDAEESGIPSRFQFEPRGQHYLFATFQKPRIADDFTAQLTVIGSLQDLSTMIAPMVSWSTTEWLTLTASGFVPLRGPGRFASVDPETGDKVSEYALAPLHWRALFEARIYY